MSGRRSRIGWWRYGLGAGLVLIGALVVLRLAIPGIVRARAESGLAERFGADVTIRGVRISLVRGMASLHGVSIRPAEEEGPPPILIGELSLRLHQGRLFDRERPALEEVRLAGVRLLAEVEPEGGSALARLLRRPEVPTEEEPEEPEQQQEDEEEESRHEPGLRLRRVLIEDAAFVVQSGEGTARAAFDSFEIRNLTVGASEPPGGPEVRLRGLSLDVSGGWEGPRPFELGRLRFDLPGLPSLDPNHPVVDLRGLELERLSIYTAERDSDGRTALEAFGSMVRDAFAESPAIASTPEDPAPLPSTAQPEDNPQPPPPQPQAPLRPSLLSRLAGRPFLLHLDFAAGGLDLRQAGHHGHDELLLGGATAGLLDLRSDGMMITGHVWIEPSELDFGAGTPPAVRNAAGFFRRLGNFGFSPDRPFPVGMSLQDPGGGEPGPAGHMPLADFLP